MGTPFHSSVAAAADGDNGAAIYSPALGPNEIRLLTIETDEGEDAPERVRCRLTRAVRDQAAYDALSYTWGYPEKTESIICNGVTVRVAPTLFNALHHLGRYQQESGCPIWIDALCLNQDDPKEKKTQVPLMHEIYSSARNVIVWLGESDSSSDDVFDLIPQFHTELAAFREAEAFGFPQPQDRFWSDLGQLIHRSWFGRLWTLQETVLARQKLIMCGTRRLGWTEFTNFLELTRVGGCREAISHHFARNPFRCNAFISDGHSKIITQLKNLVSPGAYILATLDLARYRQCLHDVDHVYAILGLLPPAIRSSISKEGLVDYSLDPGKLYTKIARKYLLEADADLELLSSASSSTKRGNMPSWCPDWASKPNIGRFLSHVPSYRAGVPSNSSLATTGLLVPGTNEDQLSVRGFRVDTVASVGVPWHPSGGEGPVTVSDEEQLCRWEESCLQISTDLGITPAIYVRTLIGNVTGAHPVPCNEDFSQQYEYFKRSMYEDAPTPDDWDQGKYIRFCMSVGQQCTGRALFGTESGQVGMGPSSAKPGDLVYVLYGGKPLYILRQRQPGSVVATAQGDKDGVCYELIGEAYMDGLMEGQAFKAEAKKPDEEVCLI